jgi:hypothetical protein
MSGMIHLAGQTPILYYDPEDYDQDGRGYSVLRADSSYVDRFAGLAEAVAAFRELCEAQGIEP